MRSLGELLDDGERFFRGSFFGHTWLLVILGAGSVNPAPTGFEILMLVVIGLNYHFFGYVHNDLIDLEVDRTQPLRSKDPLITGRISERNAWIFATIQIPISYLLAIWADASPQALVVLSIGYTATIIYNLYGKRCPIPMVTDGVQGIAWASLALFGALLMGKPTLLTIIPVGFGFGFIFLINGVHGGLRDLRNDLERGRVTTSIYLGARPITDGNLVRSAMPLQVFSWLAFAIILGPTLYVFAVGGFPYHGAVYWITVASWTMVNITSVWLLQQVVQTEQPLRLKFVYQHQLPLLVPPLMVMLPALSCPLQLTILACFFIPFVLFIPRLRNLAGYLKRPEPHPERPVE